MSKHTETFAAFYLRTRHRPWANDTPDEFAQGLVDYVEGAVARLEEARLSEAHARFHADLNKAMEKIIAPASDKLE